MGKLSKYPKVRLSLLIIAFVCMVGIYFSTFFYGTLKPKAPELPEYKIIMSVSP